MKNCLWCACLALIASVFFCQASDVSAQDADDRSDLQIADTDSNGEVTIEELKTFLTDKADKDEKELEDGDLDAWVAKIDANGNGKVSKGELRLASEAYEQVLKDKDDAKSAAAKAEKNKPPTSSVEMMDKRFQARKPVVGTKVEGLVAIDETGEELDFDQLRGKHVVIVFGCLT